MDFFSQNDIEAFCEIHHNFYYKILHCNYEDNFPLIKDLSPLEIGVLGILSMNPIINLKEIAEKLAIYKSTLTSFVDRLERRGYVNRTISSKDRRSFELILSEEAKLAQKQHVDSEKYLYTHMLKTLDSAEDIEKLITLVS